MPGGEIGSRVDGAVGAEKEHGDRVHLEVEMRRPAAGVAGITHEADHLSGPYVGAVRGQGRERREMRVRELVPLAVAQPEPIACRVVPADREQRAVGDGDERLAELSEDVDAVLVVRAT